MIRGLRLFEVFGFEVKIDPSWFIIFFLVAWSLATGWFPGVDAGFDAATLWTMGFAGALLLFVSVVLHELSHSLVARRFGIEMRGITLFLFGGVAEMTDEPPSARAELLVALAGPAASVVIAAVCGTMYALLQAPAEIAAVLEYLAVINFVLAAFNLLPAFPLDGGRVLRSLLWGINGDLRSATRWSSRIGRGFGVGMIVFGVVEIVAGNFIGGLWLGLIGLFLHGAATAAYRQLEVRNALQGEPVRRFMSADVVTVPRSISIAELVDQYVYRHHHRMFPVTDNGDLLGCVTTRDIRQVPRDRWQQETVGSVAEDVSEDNTVAVDDDAMRALAKMQSSGNARLMVVSPDRKLEGVISIKDLLALIDLETELDSSRS
ncbi:MAG: site-2 protease family protein [Acidobacteriota bacterium]|jgi:Zn-dependent protease/predicted transcriptional regulator